MSDLFSTNANIEVIRADKHSERAYLEYAMSVVKGRAIPFAADGLKPVQRRILYVLDNLNLTPTSAPAKSARIVGETIGKYHPHGDVAVYEAMVRMAQEFSLRYPIVDGQGNFGSRDGDGAAAMRYTESRLTPIADLYLSELRQGTVDWQPNYDGSLTEPKLMPARLPMLLANGSSGIGVGMACEIPSHNLTELANAVTALIKDPDCTLDELLTMIPGPDLPGGAQIVSSPAAIKAAYETGRGSLTARAIWHFEDLARGQWQLVVDELPPAASSAKILEEVEAILNPKVKQDKKSLSNDQLNLKQLASSLIDEIRDESGKDQAIRLVIIPKTSKIDRDGLVSLLLTHTSLESSVPLNLVAVDLAGNPRQMPLRELLTQWIGHRLTCLVNRTRHRLDLVLSRIHILEGQHLVFLNVDKVIRIVREAEDPRQALMDEFGLTEIQADNILDMRLRQLAGLEGIKIEQELSKLRLEREELLSLLESPPKMRRLMLKEIESDGKKYGDARRTKIEQAAKPSLEVKVVDEPVTIILSEKGWLRSRQGHGLDLSQVTFKEGDGLKSVIECRSVDPLILLATDGRTYSLPINIIPGGRGDGVPLTSLIELAPKQRIVHSLAGPLTQRVMLASSAGFGFICQIKDMASRLKAGKQFMTLTESDQLLPPAILPGADTDPVAVFCSEQGRMLVVELEEIKSLSGGKGVTLMGLNDGEALTAFAVVPAVAKLAVSGTSLSSKKQVQCKVDLDKETKYSGKRARKGSLLPVKMSPAAIVVSE